MKKESIQGKKIPKKQALDDLGDPKIWKEFSEKVYGEFRERRDSDKVSDKVRKK